MEDRKDFLKITEKHHWGMGVTSDVLVCLTQLTTLVAIMVLQMLINTHFSRQDTSLLIVARKNRSILCIAQLGSLLQSGTIYQGLGSSYFPRSKNRPSVARKTCCNITTITLPKPNRMQHLNHMLSLIIRYWQVEQNIGLRYKVFRMCNSLSLHSFTEYARYLCQKLCSKQLLYDWTQGIPLRKYFVFQIT